MVHLNSKSVSPGRPDSNQAEGVNTYLLVVRGEGHINLNLGKANAVMYACDLTEAYVDYNKGDVTDPTTLGG